MMKAIVFVSFFMIFQVFALGAGLSQAAASPIAVDISPTPYVTISKAQVVQEGTGVKVTGTVTRFSKVHLPGHVDLVLLAEDGALLEKRRISVPGLHSNRMGRMDLRFVTEMDISLPAGSRALLRYHAPGAPQSDC